MKNKVVILIVIGLIVLIGGGFWIQKKISQKRIETTIEKTTGGKASVDLDEQTIKINTNQGSWQAGKEVELPPDFPKDVPLTQGVITASTTLPQEKSYSVIIESSKNLEEIKTEYETKLPQQGWTVSSVSATANTSLISASKEQRRLTVSILKNNKNKTVVTLTIAPESE
jgi:uncharacterized protein YxeA